MAGLVRVGENLLDYILEGTKQFEWVAAALSVTIGTTSLLLFFPADVLGRYTYPMVLFLVCVNIVMTVSSVLLIIALMRNNRQQRYDTLRWLTPACLLKGVVWVKALYGVHYIWVTLLLIALILFFICTIALYHNALALKREKAKSEEATGST